MDKPFAPTGQTRFVGTTATQIGGLNEPGSSVRVLNLSSSNQSFTHGANNTITSQAAPTQSTPAQMTITMLPNSVETFSHLGLWMIAAAAAGFQVTRGDGV